MNYSLCFDIGGTKIAGALIKDGKIFNYKQTDTKAKQNNQTIIANIIAFVNKIRLYTELGGAKLKRGSMVR